MNTTAIGTPTGIPVARQAVSAASTASTAIPWLSWAGLAASAAIATGVYWDISWHETIGRDSFWTPAHLLIQFGAVVAGLASSWVIFKTSLDRQSPVRQVSVNVLGFRAPLGAFILAWGGVAMLTSAPFDDWWHNAYGLDVKIVSPPHMLLALGIFGINWGAVFLTVGQMNRSIGAERKRLEYLLLAIGGFITVQMMTVKLEFTGRVLQHSAISYLVFSIGALFVLEALARAAGHRWGRTIMAGIYTGFCLLMMWILPLFPAQPKLGPVYQNITHMVPLPFPFLIVAGAFVVDLFSPRMKNAPTFWKAVLGGVVFLAAIIAVQWPFASFLQTPAANNWFFAHNNYPYFAQPEWPEVRHVFIPWEATAGIFWRNMGLAFAISVVNMWLGIVFGNWLRQAKR